MVDGMFRAVHVGDLRLE